MHWTKKKPTKDGWWWARTMRFSKYSIFEVIGDKFRTRRGFSQLDNSEFEWSSEPIQEPKGD